MQQCLKYAWMPTANALFLQLEQLAKISSITKSCVEGLGAFGYNLSYYPLKVSQLLQCQLIIPCKEEDYCRPLHS